MLAPNLRKLNSVSIIIIAVASILFLLSSCGGGGGGGVVAAPASEGESTESSSSSSSSSSGGTQTRTLSFVTNGGNAISNMNVSDGSVASLPSADGRATWSFYKWYTDSSLTTPYNASAPVTGDMTLYAVWARNYTIDGVTYSVLSNGNVVKGDGTVVTTGQNPDALSFVDGSKTVTIVVSGTTTTATVTEGGNTRTFTDNGSGSLSARQWTVNFVSNGGNAVSQINVLDSTSASLPSASGNPTWTFYRWYSDSSLTTPYNTSASVTGNMTLYAVWARYYNIEGTEYAVLSNNKVIRTSDGAVVGTAPNPNSVNFTDGTKNISITVSGSTTTATVSEGGSTRTYTDSGSGGLSVVKRTVTFNTNGGTAVASQNINDGSTATRPSDPTKNGCTFAGWYSDAGLTSSYNFASAVNTDITVYAKWNTINYSITYNLNGGTNSASNPASYTVNTSAITLADPARTGYAFGGWYSDGGFNNRITAIPNGSTGNVILYAKWTANSYKVKFNSNGGTGTMADLSIAYGTSASLTANAFAKTGYTFSGWATSTNGAAVYANGASYTMNSTSDVTLYAVWTINTYKVVFNANGGSGSMNQQNFTYGTAQALTANAFTKTGWKFVGWATSEDGAKVYNDNQNVSNLSAINGATVTLYAVWTWDSTGFVKVAGNGTVETLWVCDHEVTQGEYETYCTYGGSSPSDAIGKGSSYPAYYVSWYDALVYCNKRSRAEGLTPCYTINGSTNPADWGSVPTSGNATWNAVTVNSSANGYRLPTDAEWEYAAKGGSSPQSFTYSGSNDIDEVAWYSGNSESKTHPVKGKKKSTLGIYDMSGNVWEWCFDLDGSYRRLRGGSWYVLASFCTVSYRRNLNPYYRNYDLGFRVVRNAN
ncbi:MAG: InlB B-repeat-containing protein [Spirochaetaceae bacterium]|nr:InlB B-repeat-containing protein [Spirochaetaceae bacterium]